MKHRRFSLPCGFREEALIAVAIDEADTALQQAVQAHLHSCQPCNHLFERYRDLQQVFTRLQDTSILEEPLQHARERLAQRLEPRPVMRLRYGLLPSALGMLYIATSERGVALVAWQDQAAQFLSTLAAPAGCEVQEDGAALRMLLAELQAYFAGTRERLAWPVDECFVRSPFQRAVLQVTAAIPYGAVMSYQSVAAALGQPRAVRAVAQALRRNPLAIVVPCHRVIGQTGHLTGYAGGLERKSALLTCEGIPLLRRPAGVLVNRERMYVGWRTERAYCTPHCPSLAAMPPGERLLLSSHAATAHEDFIPCDVCHPENASV